MGPQVVLFCLEKLRYYHHHDAIKYNILEGSRNNPECHQSFPPKRRLMAESDKCKNNNIKNK